MIVLDTNQGRTRRTLRIAYKKLDLGALWPQYTPDQRARLTSQDKRAPRVCCERRRDVFCELDLFNPLSPRGTLADVGFSSPRGQANAIDGTAR